MTIKEKPFPLLLSFILFSFHFYQISNSNLDHSHKCRSIRSLWFINFWNYTKAGPLISATSSLHPLLSTASSRWTFSPRRPNLFSKHITTTCTFYKTRISVSASTMHFHAIIVAALSAGALSISLQAKEPTWRGHSNDLCQGHASNGESA